MRRQRGVRESLGSIVLGFELIILFLGTLVAWGLHAAPAAQVITGGAVLIALSIVGILTLRYRVGAAIGFAVQVLAVVAGLWVTMMFVVGAIFLGIWIYAMYQAGRIEAHSAGQNAGAAAQQRNETENQ
ncbi:MAG: DUF4233 domain-containing protein [Microbacteriaceae bacterium]|nr:DUF4233 domain-containing protein [Microbacteriaceae bacterium]MCL2795203.1 DUF4233 domain-containing protein [Microbacteriaceae bacterium]